MQFFGHNYQGRVHTVPCHEQCLSSTENVDISIQTMGKIKFCTLYGCNFYFQICRLFDAIQKKIYFWKFLCLPNSANKCGLLEAQWPPGCVQTVLCFEQIFMYIFDILEISWIQISLQNIQFSTLTFKSREHHF